MAARVEENCSEHKARWLVLDRTVAEIKLKNAGQQPEAFDIAVDKALAEIRANRR
jgi:hypothetical protein